MYISLMTGGTDIVSYSNVDEEWIQRMLHFEREHFWPRNRADLILTLVNRHLFSGGSIIDLGCGMGYVAKRLRDQGYAVWGVEGTPQLGKRAAADRNLDVIGAVIDDLHFTRQFDAASLFDVLEHCANDVTCLETAKRAVKPNGRIFVTVPALPWLWSASDTAGGHFRRYVKRDLQRLASRCGLELSESGYFMMSLLPAVLVSRFLQRDVPVDQAIAEQHRRELRLSPVLNQVFNALLRIEKFLLGRSIPIGTSLYAVFHVIP
jgi:2-polyprenyl-3-methyl-5-hydroxy-6-metoxy-1,4-benzoquinol methylase